MHSRDLCEAAAELVNQRCAGAPHVHVAVQSVWPVCGYDHEPGHSSNTKSNQFVFTIFEWHWQVLYLNDTGNSGVFFSVSAMTQAVYCDRSNYNNFVGGYDDISNIDILQSVSSSLCLSGRLCF